VASQDGAGAAAGAVAAVAAVAASDKHKRTNVKGHECIPLFLVIDDLYSNLIMILQGVENVNPIHEVKVEDLYYSTFVLLFWN
jgi:hypothetical protein